MVTDEYRTMNRAINGKVDSMINVRCEDSCEECVSAALISLLVVEGPWDHLGGGDLF